MYPVPGHDIRHEIVQSRFIGESAHNTTLHIRILVEYVLHLLGLHKLAEDHHLLVMPVQGRHVAVREHIAQIPAAIEIIQSHLEVSVNVSSPSRFVLSRLKFDLLNMCFPEHPAGPTSLRSQSASPSSRHRRPTPSVSSIGRTSFQTDHSAPHPTSALRR